MPHEVCRVCLYPYWWGSDSACPNCGSPNRRMTDPKDSAEFRERHTNGEIRLRRTDPPDSKAYLKRKQP